MSKYRWETPHDWIWEKIAEGEFTAYEVLQDVLPKMDSDDLQDIYQEEMDKDGYFNDLDKVKEEVDEEE